jgi:hypothetical protein
MYLLILSFETVNKLKLFFERGIPLPQDWGTPLLALLQKNLTHFIISIAVLEQVPPDAGLQKRATFSTLNPGLAGTPFASFSQLIPSCSRIKKLAARRKL